MNDKDAILEIDLARLDENCASQPQIIRQWGDMLAAAKKDAALKKGAVKLCRADLFKRVMQRPAAFGLAKITVDGVDAVVDSHPMLVQAINDQIEADYQVDILKSMVDALHDRRSELENLVKLHGQMYFAKPDTSGKPKDRPKINPAKPVGKVKRK